MRNHRADTQHIAPVDRPQAIRPELVAEAAHWLLEGLPVPRRYWPALGWWALRGLRAAEREDVA